MTQWLKCKYCEETKSGGGTIFKDIRGNEARACWRDECRVKYVREQAAIRFKERRELRLKSECWYIDIDGFCKKSKIRGEDLCLEHLTKRCSMCGTQATHVCPFLGLAECKEPLCDAHVHHHKNAL
jgi:hypothetical protein